MSLQGVVKRPELEFLDLLFWNTKIQKYFLCFFYVAAKSPFNFPMLNRFRNYNIFLGAVTSFIFVIPSEKFQ